MELVVFTLLMVNSGHEVNTDAMLNLSFGLFLQVDCVQSMSLEVGFESGTPQVIQIFSCFECVCFFDKDSFSAFQVSCCGSCAA